MDPWATLAEVAHRQVFTLASWQVRYVGISGRALQDHLRHHGGWRPYRGVVALPSEPSPRQLLAAALVVAGRPVTAFARTNELVAKGVDIVDALVQAALDAGQTAYGASSLALRELVPPPAQPWVRVPGQCGRAQRKDLKMRFGNLCGSVQLVQGLPASCVEQGIVEFAAELPLTSASLDTLGRVAQKADRRRLATVDTLSAHLDVVGSIPGARLTGELCRHLKRETTHSATERAARRLAAEVLRPYGLKLHPRPYLVEVNGVKIAEADLAVVEIKYDMEIDGPDHLDPEQVLADQARDLRMRRADWEVERFPVSVIDHQPRLFQRRVDATVRALLARRARLAGLTGRTNS